MKKNKNIPFIAAIILISITCSCRSLKTITYDSETADLYKLINRYRVFMGLEAVPASAALKKVARIHARDLQDRYYLRDKARCNMHSWSASGKWTSCCYTQGHEKAPCMWNKPRELTGYRGNGYEIAASIHGALMTPYHALRIWIKSPGHHNMILNRKVWKKYQWKAMGAAFTENYAVVWFGTKADIEKE